MKVPQGNSLCSYLKQAKLSFFSFFCKTDVQDGGTGPSWGEVDVSWRGEEVEKGCRRVNIVQILYTNVYKWKNNPH
jgi:hypothetical protein